MATVGSLISTLGKQIILHRSYTASPTKTIPTRFSVGVNNDVPNISDTSLDNQIPISDGTIIDDGSVILVGKFGGTNSSGTTTRYKDGAGTNDATSQELITNTTAGTKHWSGTASNSGTSSQLAGLWLYISNSTARDKFKTSGTAVQLRMGSGTSTNYYYKDWTQANLTTGWNWLNSGTSIVNLSSAGTPVQIDSWALEIITNNATDTFSNGAVLFDLLRQWKEDDEYKNWVSGTYPVVNESTMTVEMRGELTTSEANGFDIDAFADSNSGTMMSGEDVFTSESKSNTDKFTFIVQNRLN